MPEAPVDEYRESHASEYHVCTAPGDLRQGEVDPEAKSCAMERTAQCEFWCGVPPALNRHARPDYRVDRSDGRKGRGRQHILGQRVCARATHPPARIL